MNPDTATTALAAAREAAAAAATIITHYWRRGVAVELKADATPVTARNREAEQAIRGVLQAALPQASIYGEEYGLQGERDALLWLVDPLDGTKSFVRRTPFFSTQIALMDRHELVLGVSSAPVYGETMWASAGGGAWFEGERVRVAETTEMAQASISIGNVRTLAGDARWAALGGLIRRSATASVATAISATTTCWRAAAWIW
ncbi:Inositol-phosphate phosphatase OS=Rhodanobacter lindaniclasticus OX=75310 GN=B1991_01475 PE=3 SV=1 [Rhodanobacter lindaniclasticus]